jgi:hypothetical protein
MNKTYVYLGVLAVAVVGFVVYKNNTQVQVAQVSPEQQNVQVALAQVHKLQLGLNASIEETKSQAAAAGLAVSGAAAAVPTEEQIQAGQLLNSVQSVLDQLNTELSQEKYQ